MYTETVWGKYTDTYAYQRAFTYTYTWRIHAFARTHIRHMQHKTNTSSRWDKPYTSPLVIRRDADANATPGANGPQRGLISLDLSKSKPRRRHGSLQCLARVDRTNQYRTSRWAYKMASGDLFILFLPRERERQRERERILFRSYTRFFSSGSALSKSSSLLDLWNLKFQASQGIFSWFHNLGFANSWFSLYSRNLSTLMFLSLNFQIFLYCSWRI